jgi:hypothetical protein
MGKCSLPGLWWIITELNILPFSDMWSPDSRRLVLVEDKGAGTGTNDFIYDIEEGSLRRVSMYRK